MVAILRWLVTHFLASAVSEVFKKAAMFMAFNIVLQFVLAYVTNNSVGGLTLFGVGGTVSQQLSAVITPQAAYVLDCFYVVPGLFLILNAYLARFAYRLTIRAMAGH